MATSGGMFAVLQLPMNHVETSIMPPYNHITNTSRTNVIVRCREPKGEGILHNFQYGEVHANIWGLKFCVNQYLGSVM